MRTVIHLTPDDARQVPWKNGRGVTEELALWPQHAAFERDDFDWRISKAQIVENGPFSRFESCERVLVVTGGDGLTLVHEEESQRIRLRRFEPYLFRGDRATSAELARGPVADFNVITRRGVADASVEALALGSRRTLEALPAGHSFVHVVQGRVVARAVGEEDPFELEAGDSLWISETHSDEDVELAGVDLDSALLVVRVTNARRS